MYIGEKKSDFSAIRPASLKPVIIQSKIILYYGVFVVHEIREICIAWIFLFSNPVYKSKIKWIRSKT